jgi:cell wall-associated NlpC family hydrolase
VQHLALLDRPAADWVSEAERLLGAPYLWGGRTPMGIDCSGLVQQALHGAGHPCPRDSDQQARALGRALDAGTPPRRGDLLFWRGHVGVMLDGSRLLHANIHHMAVAVEPLAEAVARIEGNGGGPVTRHARLDAPVPAR